MQNVNKCSSACTNFGLIFSTKKTEVLHQPAPGNPYISPSIIVDGQPLTNVNKFPYLFSFKSQHSNIGYDITVRITKATAKFGRLHGKVWD